MKAREPNSRIPLIFFPYDAKGDLGCGEGVHRLHNRISNYLAVEDDRTKVYRFFEYNDRFEVMYFEPRVSAEGDIIHTDVGNKVGELVSTSQPFIFFGGNHYSILPILESYSQNSPRTLLLTFDSHIDSFTSDLLGSQFSQRTDLDFSTYLSKYLTNSSSLGFFHIGSKHPLRDKVQLNKKIAILTVQDLLLKKPMYTISRLKEQIDRIDCQRIHIDIDIDILDHSTMMAVFDPSSFGLQMDQLLKLIRNGIDLLPLSGVSIVGYNPRIMPHVCYEEVCLRLFENLVYLIADSEINRGLWF